MPPWLTTAVSSWADEGGRAMRRYLQFEFLVPVAIGLALSAPASAGTITLNVVDDKGTVAIPNGFFQHVFGSHMSMTLGPEWGELAGHFERNNNEHLVWVNTGPPTILHFANIFPKEIDVPENPNPNHFNPISFFDIFVELDINNHPAPLEQGMQIQGANMQGSSGALYPGLVTPINDLSNLPTSNANDTKIVWDLSQFATTTGNFVLIEYDLPNAFEATKTPEPSAFILLGTAIAVWVSFQLTRRAAWRKPAGGSARL
jgi:hypothetical protein